MRIFTFALFGKILYLINYQEIMFSVVFICLYLSVVKSTQKVMNMSLDIFMWVRSD